MYNSYEEPSTAKFVSASVVIHACVFASLIYIASQIPELRPKDEPVLMEIIPLYGSQMLAAPTEAAVASPAPTPAPLEEAVSPVMATSKSEDVVVLPKKSIRKNTVTKMQAKPVALRKASPKAVVKANPNLSKEISDLENEMENLSANAVAVPFDSNNLNDLEVEKELSQVQQKISTDQEQILKQELVDNENNLKSVSDDFDKEYSQAENANQQEAQKIDQWAQDRKAALGQEKALLAQQVAKERALEAQAAKATRAGGMAQAGAGAAIGVRALEDLKQMPGNERPRYDLQDRLQKRQGKVQFLAYISKEGYPTKFKLEKSTGFRELDGKTLAALKKWKFYPGQEGWVEIPFVWDLTGEAKEFPTGLRRR